MARTSNITESLVHETARKLDAGGVKPTIRAIRDVLGEGSLTTIANFMQSYQPENVQGAIEAPEYPPELESTFSAVWRDCYAAAHAMFDDERQGLIKSVQRSEKTASELGATADDLAEELEKARAEIESLRRQCSALEMDRDDLKLRHAELTGEFRGLQEAIKAQSAMHPPVIQLEQEQDGVLPPGKRSKKSDPLSS